MKKKLLGLLALIAAGGSALAGNKPIITVADVEATPGETVSFAVTLADGKANTYTAMTLYAYFPTEGFSTTGAYTVADAWTGAMGVVGDVNTTTGLATIPFASADAITGAYVTNLVTVSFKVDESVAVGSYDVTLRQTLFEYNTSDKDYADDVTFKVKVVARHTVVLDETSTTAPAAAEDVNVTVKRTINANEWSTICLPFAMTAEQVAAAFGSNVQIADFTGCDAEYDDDENVLSLKVKFCDVNVIEPNHPYIIKVSQTVTEFTVDEVDIEVEDEPSVDCDEWRTGSGTKKDPYVYHYNSFVGTYVAQTTVPNESLFLSDNKFWYSAGLTKMKAFRAYFDFYDVLSEVEQSSARVYMSFDDETTGIYAIPDSPATVPGCSPPGPATVPGGSQLSAAHGQAPICHDLSGRRVEKPGKGLYIKDGKKMVVK